MNTSTGPCLMTIQDAAKYLNVSERFVRDRRSDGQLHAVKLGGLLRFDRRDLDAYIDACREHSVSADLHG